MKLLFFECNMGASGDMIISALSQFFDDRELLLKKINSIGLPDITVSFEQKKSCSITGVHTTVLYKGMAEEPSHHHKHHNTGIQYINGIIDRLHVGKKVREDAKNIYSLIAQAESFIHGCDVGAVHFHELGMMDAIADVVLCSYLINEINPDKICVSPINTGSGQIKCMHGIMPVPAPATAHILKGIPSYSNEIKGELCTPTGAAVLKYFADSFGGMPPAVTEKIGYGIGEKDFENAANCIRAFLCEYEKSEGVIGLDCNIDDMTAEDLSFACEILLDNGALDVWQVPIVMKKSRQATMLSVLCFEEDRDKMLNLIFRHTSTIGIRESKYNRHRMSRNDKTIMTDYGNIDVKISQGYGVKRVKPEYEQLRKIAFEKNIPIETLRQYIKKDIK